MITLTLALEIAQATIANGRRLGAAPLTVVVLDSGGHDVAVFREDGSGILRPQIARAKAWGALGMGFSSREIANRAASMPAFYGAVAVAAEGRLVPVPGGVLVRAKGRLLGAVGVSGDQSDVDEECAISAVLHCQLQPEPSVAGS
ncbi:heme-binding protein [Acidothermaceae bacterium B102]|nr:heme-binding protein [Acidothermaceae bacterium B102]